jgi:serine/threonine-protein kinase
MLEAAGVSVVGQLDGPATLMSRVKMDRPDVVLLDIRMPPTHTTEGILAAEQLRSVYPELAVLVLSQFVEPSYALRLLHDHPEGMGYLLKDRIHDPAILIDALRRLTESETVVDPTIVARLLGRKRVKDPLEVLSMREREILALVAEGLANRAIADRLSITDRTVGPTPRGSSSSSIYLRIRARTGASWPCSPTSALRRCETTELTLGWIVGERPQNRPAEPCRA